jgi:hypothetical protein
MKTSQSPLMLTKRELNDYGIILIIAFKADSVTIGNFQNRKDEKSCSLESFNDPYKYKLYKNS